MYVLHGTYFAQTVIRHSLDRWCAEQVKAVVIHTRHFIANNAGFPVLRKHFQLLIGRFLLHHRRVHVIFKGPARIKPSIPSIPPGAECPDTPDVPSMSGSTVVEGGGSTDYSYYFQYIRYLQKQAVNDHCIDGKQYYVLITVLTVLCISVSKTFIFYVW